MTRILLLLFLFLPRACEADVAARDDSGHVVSLERHAQRIVSLAPNITELLFAAGAGDRVAGVVQYSNYPQQALKIESVGNAQALDIERIAALHPDLVVAWKSGNPPAQVGELRSLGIPVFYVEPRRLADIPDDIEKLGMLSGTGEVANRAAAGFRMRLASLRARYSRKSRVRVFYEVWPDPLMTVSNAHIISDVMQLCGATNVFGNLPVLVPTVGIEAVIHAHPDAIVASGDGYGRPKWLDDWRKWDMAASGKNRLFFIPADLISRQSPRILTGAEMLCKEVDSVRGK